MKCGVEAADRRMGCGWRLNAIVAWAPPYQISSLERFEAGRLRSALMVGEGTDRGRTAYRWMDSRDADAKTTLYQLLRIVFDVRSTASI